MILNQTAVIVIPIRNILIATIIIIHMMDMTAILVIMVINIPINLIGVGILIDQTILAYPTVHDFLIGLHYLIVQSPPTVLNFLNAQNHRNSVVNAVVNAMTVIGMIMVPSFMMIVMIAIIMIIMTIIMIMVY